MLLVLLNCWGAGIQGEGGEAKLSESAGICWGGGGEVGRAVEIVGQKGL